MTEINLSVQFDHSAAGSRLGGRGGDGGGKVDLCLRKSRTGHGG